MQSAALLWTAVIRLAFVTQVRERKDSSARDFRLPAERIPVESLALFVAEALCAGPAFGATITLTPPTGSVLGYGAGSTRGDIISMSSDLALTSIGIQAAIDAGFSETFSAYVYDGTGTTQLAVGANTGFIGDGTEQFYTLPIAYTLLAGHSYDIGIDFHSFNDPHLQVRYYFFDGPGDPPFVVGPVTVIDGEESHDGPGNIFTPNLQLNATAAVPEPGTMTLVATGVFGLVGALRRRLQS